MLKSYQGTILRVFETDFGVGGGVGISTIRQLRFTRKRYTLVGTCVAAMLVFSLAAIVLEPQIAKAANVIRYEGISGIYGKIREYNYPWTHPNIQWETASPQSVGIDDTAIETLRNNLAASSTKAFLVIKDGKLIYEWYQNGGGPNNKYSTAAMAKAVTASVALAAAVDDGLIKLDDPVSKYAPEWRDDPIRSKITIRQLGSHSSGLEDVNFPPSPDDPEWKHTYYDHPDLRFALALDSATLIDEPGARYHYSGVGFYVLAYALTNSLQMNGDEGDSNIHDYIEHRVMEPLGIPRDAWSISYGDSYDIDGLELQAFGSGVKQTTRSIAEIGQLVLNKGEWNGTQIISPEVIDDIVRYEGSNPGRTGDDELPPMGIGWHTNVDGFISSLPRDAIIGIGNGPQIALIVPSMDLVAVRIGGPLTEEGATSTAKTWVDLEGQLFRPLVASVNPSQVTKAFATASR